MSGLFLGLTNCNNPEKDFQAEFVTKPKTNLVGEYITLRVNLRETFSPWLFWH